MDFQLDNNKIQKKEKKKKEHVYRLHVRKV